ncbi:hypothetical protein, partial [Photobacterium gaetbulicola]|uniref:hypothetical protein n=1 Tax=Photobacterium gaetbulicola TaxID=1295392 RepID=UPI001B803CF9
MCKLARSLGKQAVRPPGKPASCLSSRGCTTARVSRHTATQKACCRAVSLGVTTLLHHWYQARHVGRVGQSTWRKPLGGPHIP